MAETKATRKPAAKKATARKTTAKKAAPARAKTTVKTVDTSTTDTRATKKNKLPDNVVNVMLAELVGTFVLASVAIMTVMDITPLYVGLTLAVLFMTLGLVSGSHLNPAVSFGLWTVGKLRAVMLPFYWVAQVIGAMAAVVVSYLVSTQTFGLDFSKFFEFSTPLFVVELAGAAVFLFALTTVVSRVDLSATGKALGVGLSLFVGLVVAGSLYSSVPADAEAEYLKELQTVAGEAEEGVQPDMAKLREVPIPQAMLVGGTTLNPAIAIAATESTTENEIYSKYGIGDAANADQDPLYSRASLQVILATFIGAGLGANLSRMLAYRFK